MSWILPMDPDEYEWVTESKSYGTYPGTDVPFGSGSAGWRRRSDEEIASLKAARKSREAEARAARVEAARRAFGDALSCRVNMDTRLGDVPVHVLRDAMAEALTVADGVPVNGK